MTTLDDIRRLGSTEQGLGTVATTRSDGSVHASVVNAGVMPHPVTGADTVAFVARRSARKVELMRDSGRASVTFRRGWRWGGVEGPVSIIEADDPATGIALALLLRAVFSAAGGTHDDWEKFDQVMAAEERLAIFVAPARIIGQA
jgi:hypothetical protein